MIERRAHARAGKALRWYFNFKFRPFRSERRPRDDRRGLIALQIDALSHADLERALQRGYCPTLERLLANGYAKREWFCGLPSATPYCQAGIFHGENDGIPAFRFYDKAAGRVITCNAPQGVQYIRDRIRSPGALAGGSSYVNLLDGDAQTVAFTVATREKVSVYQRLGGSRLALLMMLHPGRMARIVVQSMFEWLLEEWERLRGELAGRSTHSEGIFPFIRILSNVVVRELQTMAIMLDVYLGVPVIYSTFMQYDELAHHFGPSSKQALADLRRTDARIAEIERMARVAGGRAYDLVILSDHGMTPARSYRVLFGESLGATVQRFLSEPVAGQAGDNLRGLSSHAEASEYSDMGAEVLEAVAQLAPVSSHGRRWIRKLRDWVRSRYGLREIIFPEKYRIDAENDVVVTYSSCLALVYFTATQERLSAGEIRADARWRRLLEQMIAHPGIGLVAAVESDNVHLAGKTGTAVLSGGRIVDVAGENPLAPYGLDPLVLSAVEALVKQHNAGDLVLFGSYEDGMIVSFDDQIGAHGSAGGDQVRPFILSPVKLGLESEKLENARDIHRAVMTRYAIPPDISEAIPAG